MGKVGINILLPQAKLLLQACSMTKATTALYDSFKSGSRALPSGTQSNLPASARHAPPGPACLGFFYHLTSRTGAAACSVRSATRSSRIPGFVLPIIQSSS